MKDANIISILNAYRSLPKPIFDSYLTYFPIKIREKELQDLEKLYAGLKVLGKQVKIFDKYYIGYTIPQIGKEFDLLRFAEDSIVNIELKSKSTTNDIKKQLIRNKYYLSFLEKELYLYTFVSSENKIYHLNGENQLVEIDKNVLIEKLKTQNAITFKDINEQFNPSHYLVSPFNSPDKFMSGNYFLTTHQEMIKNEILEQINLPHYSILTIKGKSGTGKTLLTYDIVKTLNENLKILVIHGVVLYEGHHELIENYGWHIIDATQIKDYNLSNFDLLIIDEAQRLELELLQYLLIEIKRNAQDSIFTYDELEYLNPADQRDQKRLLFNQYLTVPPYELTSTIRTNREVTRFIQYLFNKKETINRLDYTPISLQYFDCYETASLYINQLEIEGWTIIDQRTFNNEDNAFDFFTIQDSYKPKMRETFENVVAVLDAKFFYNTKGELEFDQENNDFNIHHPTAQLLFNLMSKTKLQLTLIIINNSEVLQRSLQILNKSIHE
ncbi:MAG: DNA/RNA helicase domain-containing protein [Weeksellaceae bacterium]